MSFTQHPDWIAALQLPADVEQAVARVRMYTYADGRPSGDIVTIADQEVAELLGITAKRAGVRLDKAAAAGVLTEQARWIEHPGTARARRVRRWQVPVAVPAWWDGRPAECSGLRAALPHNGGPGLRTWSQADEQQQQQTEAPIPNQRTHASAGSHEDPPPGSDAGHRRTHASGGTPNRRTHASADPRDEQHESTLNKRVWKNTEEQQGTSDGPAADANNAGADVVEAPPQREDDSTRDTARRLLASLPLPNGEAFYPHEHAIRFTTEALQLGMPPHVARQRLLDGVSTAGRPGGRVSWNAQHLPEQARELAVRAERREQRDVEEHPRRGRASAEHQQRTSQWIRKHVLHQRAGHGDTPESAPEPSTSAAVNAAPAA